MNAKLSEVLYGMVMGLCISTPVDIVRQTFADLVAEESFWKAQAQGQALRADPEAAQRIMDAMLTEEVRDVFIKEVGRGE